jgi:TonB family protein
MAYHLAQTEVLPRRTLAVGGILALHLLVVYLLATGLIHTIAAPEPPAITMKLMNDPPRVTPVPPRTRDPHLRQRTTEIAVPPVEWQPPPAAADSPAEAMLAVTGEPNRLPEPAAEPLRVVGSNQLPNTEEFYPADRRRLGIEGASHVRVCVDARGSRQGEPVLEQSSGDSELDHAALNVARHGRYARAQQGGMAVPNCYRFRIVFKQVTR